MSIALAFAAALQACGGGSGTAPASAVSPAPAPAAVQAPCGIYILDSRQGALRDANFRSYAWVNGYVLRLGWADVETSPGVFDFTLIDNAMARAVALGQKLTLLLPGAEPAHVVAQAADTWLWIDPNLRHDETGDCSAATGGCTRPLPWDAATLARYQTFVQALAAHAVRDGTTDVPLSRHSKLATIGLGLPGWGRVRELGFEVKAWPGYTRAKLKEATLAQLRIQASAFPSTPLQVGWWPIQDADTAAPLWRELLDAALSAHGSRLAVEQENLRHAISNGADAFGPLPDGQGQSLLRAAAGGGSTALQMLTSWTQPFTSGTEGGSPVTAIDWARSSFGARYFEIYVADADAAETDSSRASWKTGFTRIHSELACR